MLQTLRLLLPALIPSWRFFDEIAPSPRIEFALLENPEDAPTLWQEFRPRPAQISAGTMLLRLVWNPRWNESLFLVSCAERLIDEPTDHSYQEIIKRIVADVDRTAGGAWAAPYVQFRLIFIHRNDAALEKEVLFVSSSHLSSDVRR